ncbi:odorant receptor 49b-like [Sitophilus oryzae]|uniref:Odorant receptor 49b-like n=1 Tax=Sitophilus oryzae TaxID=7048 RepID=A0A6J2XBP1_SITOR|nr:odorant receptor 49b-like [Sitophilus oryzae]
MNESVKYVTLMEYLLNSFSVASVMFQLITIKSAVKFMFAFLFICMLVCQIFIFAWTANEIKEQSIALSDYIYKSPWYNSSEEVKKLLAIMMIRAQKPLVVTLGPFSPMTSNTALTTIKAAYSYATVMLNGYKEE